jgi:hypothetical protein
MGWPTNPRPARSLVQLRDQVRGLRPGLPAAGFGMIGDPAHQARESDHNPRLYPGHRVGGSTLQLVRALDIPLKVGDGNRRLAGHLRRVAKGNRLLGRKPHPAFGRYGYIISDRRIASSSTGWRWVRYRGADPHTGHVHVSVARALWRADTAAGWRLKPRHVR